MKRIKCYGKKQTKFIDTSKTEAFFDDPKLQKRGEAVHHKKGFDDHKEKELDSFYNDLPLKTSKSHESLFESFILEPQPKGCLKLDESIKLIKKKPHLKVKKYKGKRRQKGTQKGKKSSMLRKSVSVKGVPDWSSICKHQLIVKKSASNKQKKNDICGDKTQRKSFMHSTSSSGKISRLKLKKACIELNKLESDRKKVPIHRSSLTQRRSCRRKLIPQKSPEKNPRKSKTLHVLKHNPNTDQQNAISTSFVKTQQKTSNSFSHLKNIGRFGKKSPFHLKDLRVVLEKLKIDPNNDVASSSTTPSNISNSSLCPLKNNDIPGKKPLIQLRDLRVVLEKLEIDSNKDVASNFGTTNTSNSSLRPLKNSDTSAKKSRLQLKDLRVVLEKLKIDSNNYVSSNSTTPISFDLLKNKNNFSNQNYIPYASTPAKSIKKLHGGHINNFDLSPIPTYEHKRTTKQAFAFEDSISSQVSVSNASRRSVNPTKQGMSKKLHLPLRCYSNIERSIYLQSHSSAKKVADYDSEHFSILPQLLELCNQNEVFEFSKIYDLRKTGFRKIGEGSYGEVFCLTKNKKSFIIKVIPISEQFSDSLQSMASVYSEIKVSRCLNKLRNNEIYQTKNFNLLKGSHVVKGCYPDQLLKAWDKFSREKTALNIRPDVFDEEQMFVIIELEYGGQDLSSFVLRNACEAEIVFKQLAISLAIAEEVNLFEHRDLHLGNILVKRTKNKSVSYTFRGERFSIASEGLMVNIIDFTLSRILEGGVIYYNDLADDKSLFEQTGDLQFNVYKATKLQLENKWHECLLYSNVLWLTFLCQKLQEHNYSRPSSIKHVKSMHNIKMLITQMIQCKSALDCLEACKIFQLPDKIEGRISTQSSGTVFIDRKSLQKGKTFSLLD